MSGKRSKCQGLAVLKKPTQQKEWIQRTYTASKTIDKLLKMSYAIGELFRKEKQ
jgi:hypothetical protein